MLAKLAIHFLARISDKLFAREWNFYKEENNEGMKEDELYELLSDVVTEMCKVCRWDNAIKSGSH